MNTQELKQIPSFKSDEEAEHFVDTADLSEYDLSGLKPMRFDLDEDRPGSSSRA